MRRTCSATVDFARGAGVRVAVQGTGHGAFPLGPLDGTLLLKTTRMTGVEIDPETRRARAEAGALWGDVVAAAGEHGLAALHGSSPDTGVVGYTLGGGIGWLARREGLACNRVRAVELVTADGQAATRRRERRPGPVLGAARRRRQLRRRDGDRVRPARAAAGLRRRAVLARSSQLGDPARLPRVGPRRARGVDLDHPPAAPATAARRARAAARHARDRPRLRLCRRPGRRARS